MAILKLVQNGLREVRSMAERAAEDQADLLLYLIDMAILEVERQAQYRGAAEDGFGRSKQYVELKSAG